ncbi:hypothetical protein [Kordiimonas sp.]|uniref:hypothetical protein n=1 Tax=Kordiimonas sp. TaxID=1970157 RepID=UPI003A8D64C2
MQLSPQLERISAHQEHQLKIWLQHCPIVSEQVPDYQTILAHCGDEARRTIVVHDVISPQRDFRFRHMGDAVLENTRENYTGKRLSELPGKGEGSKIWQFLADVADARMPNIDIMPYVGPSGDISHVTLLALPVADDGVTVDAIILVVDFVKWPFLMEEAALAAKSKSLRLYLKLLYDKHI